MLDLLLNDTFFLAGLIALAILTPLAAWGLWRLRPGLPLRALIAGGASGPIALALWGIHNAVLGLFGFAHVASALVMLALGSGIGLGLGWWVRAERTTTASKE